MNTMLSLPDLSRYCQLPDELPCLPLSRKRELPKGPGVYFVLGEDDEVLYVGQCISLHGRWLAHNKLLELQSIRDVRVSWIELETTEFLGEVETVLIGHFSPRLNGSRGRGKRKSSDPEFSPTTVFLRKSTKLKATIKANQLLLSGKAGNMDLSDILESLLLEWAEK
jgi:hypothetical protein